MWIERGQRLSGSWCHIGKWGSEWLCLRSISSCLSILTKVRITLSITRESSIHHLVLSGSHLILSGIGLPPAKYLAPTLVPYCLTRSSHSMPTQSKSLRRRDICIGVFESLIGLACGIREWGGTSLWVPSCHREIGRRPVVCVRGLWLWLSLEYVKSSLAVAIVWGLLLVPRLGLHHIIGSLTN